MTGPAPPKDETSSATGASKIWLGAASRCCCCCCTSPDISPPSFSLPLPPPRPPRPPRLRVSRLPRRCLPLLLSFAAAITACASTAETCAYYFGRGKDICRCEKGAWEGGRERAHARAGQKEHTRPCKSHKGTQCYNRVLVGLFPESPSTVRRIPSHLAGITSGAHAFLKIKAYCSCSSVVPATTSFASPTTTPFPTANALFRHFRVYPNWNIFKHTAHVTNRLSKITFAGRAPNPALVVYG